MVTGRPSAGYRCVWLNSRGILFHICAQIQSILSSIHTRAEISLCINLFVGYFKNTELQSGSGSNVAEMFYKSPGILSQHPDHYRLF